MNKKRYPHMHVAQSTVNRILNVAAGIPQPVTTSVPPAQPDVAAQGAALDVQLQESPNATPELPEGADGPVVAAMMTGEDPVLAATLPKV